MKLVEMIWEQLHNVLYCEGMSECNEMSIFNESINHYHNSIPSF
jgi:hypothetical protein